jgi:spermidine synthase
VKPQLTISPWYTLQLDFVRALWVVLPGAVFWGASFPLALASMASGTEDPGRLVGRVYAANTVGAIVGAMVVSLVLAGTVGTQVTQRILICSAGVSAVLLLGPWGRGLRRPAFNAGTIGWSGAAIVAAFLLSGTVGPVPGLLAAYGRYSATWFGSEGEIVYVGEGTHATLAVTRQWSGSLNYHNAGKIQASSEPQDMRLQRMLGHFTTLIPENPRSVMVIGLGAGVTAGAVSIDPAVEKVTIVELEPLVPEVVSTYFSEHNFSVVTNPKVDIRIDDGRHFLLTTDQTFDAIVSQPGS